MATADPISEALEQALSGNIADSQTATESSPEGKQQAASSAAKAPSDAKTASAKEGTDSKAESKAVPYERFSEVIAQKNEAFEKIKSLENMFEGASKREDALRDRLGELETEHQILDAIRSLAKDPKYRDHVMTIDKALQGIEEEVAEAQADGDDEAVAEAERRFAEKAEELEELISEQKAESLWEQSNNFASELLKALPEVYTDVDKARLSQLWTPRVDWDTIEESGREAIPTVLKESLGQLLKDYGLPQGALAKQTREEVLKTVPAAAEAALSPEQKVDAILGKAWSDVDEKGKPVESDAEFARSMADLMKATRTS